MSKITVGLPPNFSPLLCKQKNWEKIECQIEQHKKHTYNITTVGPFFFLNPTNKKNYPFMIFLPNYIPEALPKKSNRCTISLNFPKSIPSITFLSSKDDLIKEMYEYIVNSKSEMTIFLNSVKISECINSNYFEQFCENYSKPIKVISSVQFMGGKWKLQTLYKDQPKELKTITIESPNVIALPCYEVPHKFGSNENVINSFVIISKTESSPIYFKTPEIDEMIKWILFLYAYLNNSPNTIGLPFSHIQAVSNKQVPSNQSQPVKPLSPKPKIPTSNANSAANNAKEIQRSQTSAEIQSPNPRRPVRRTSDQVQRQRSSVTINPKPISTHPAKQQQINNSNSTPLPPSDQKRKVLERKNSGQILTGNRPNQIPQMNNKRTMQPSSLDPRAQFQKIQMNLSQPELPTQNLNKPNVNSSKPAQSLKSSDNSASLAAAASAEPFPSFATAPASRPTGNRKSSFFSDVDVSPSIPVTTTNTEATTNTANPTVSTTTIDSNESENKIATNIINSNTTITPKNEPEKEEDFDFSFESVDIEEAPVTKHDTAFPAIQFTEIKKDDQNSNKNEDDSNNQSTNSTPASETSSNNAVGGRARSFTIKRRISSISSQALDSIRNDKSKKVDNNDDYNIPSDMEARLERSFADLKNKYANAAKDDEKSEIFKVPSYNDIISNTLVSMSTFLNTGSRTMQIKTLINTIGDDGESDIVDFPYVDQNDEETVEATLNNMSSEDKIDLDSFFKFSEYPEYDVSQLANSGRPKNTFINEFTQLDQGLRQSGSASLDLNNVYVVRLCFLVACTIVNGLKDFVDQSSTVSLIDPLKEISTIIPDLDQIVTEINKVQTTCEQASIVSTMLIKKNLLGDFVREVKKSDKWPSKFYLPSAMFSNYEFLDTFVLILEPILNTMTFNIESSSTLFKTASADDINRYALTPLFAYLEIDDLFSQGTDPVKVISRQFEIGLKKSKKFLNLTAWEVLEKLSQDQRYSASYYSKYMNSINASKAFFGTAKSKFESWISEALNSKSIHQYFMLVHINLTLMNSPNYYEESSLMDQFRANYIMKKLCKYISSQS